MTHNLHLARPLQVWPRQGGTTMKLKFLRSTVLNGTPVFPGEIHEVGKADVVTLTMYGHAEAVPKESAKLPEPATATEPVKTKSKSRTRKNKTNA